MSKVHSCKGFKMSTSLTSFLLFAFFLGCASAPAPTETQTFDEEDSDDYITDFYCFRSVDMEVVASHRTLTPFPVPKVDDPDALAFCRLPLGKLPR